MIEYASLNEAVAAVCGSTVSVAGRRSAMGGDINDAETLTLSDGTRLFMKSNRRDNIGFFRAEAEGLSAMRRTGTVRVPEVLAIGTDGGRSFLLLETIETGYGRRGAGSGRGDAQSDADPMEELGRSLAAMHRAETGVFICGGVADGRIPSAASRWFGFVHDNYIGASVQINTPAETWIEFFAERRLRPQFERAAGYFDRDERSRFDAFLGRLDRYLIEPAAPSLLHGDLWGGTYMIDADGRPWLIDPAAYVGHAEADIAMTELFGGFGYAFYRAYEEVLPMEPGYADRRDLYNLYHLLNHLNLFGGGYLHSVRSILRRY